MRNLLPVHSVRHAGERRVGGTTARSSRSLAGALAIAASFALSATAWAGSTRATPFPAWGDPQIKTSLTVDEAKAIVAERTKRQTEWKGPTSGPKATDRPGHHRLGLRRRSLRDLYRLGPGVKEAAKALGWTVVSFNGQGTVSGQLAAMQQALASQPAAIITPADASALQKPIKEAIAAGIPVIGIHATAFPGPHPDLGLYTRTSPPAPPRSANCRPPT